jgi:hypothetical protein
VVRLKAPISLFAVVALLTLVITPLPIEVMAQNTAPSRLTASDISAAPGIFIYKADENWPMDHWANPDCTHPIIYTDNGNATIKVRVTPPSDVYYPAGQDTIMNAGAYLTSVSYKASWQGNNTIILFDSTSDGEFDFNLTSIPYGDQYIEVSASCNVLLFENGFSSSYPVPQNGTHAVNFTVAPVPTAAPPSTPASTSTAVNLSVEQVVTMVAIFATVAIVTLAFYKRPRRKRDFLEADAFSSALLANFKKKIGRIQVIDTRCPPVLNVRKERLMVQDGTL